MDLASLQIKIDSRKAQQAKKDLDDLATAAGKTEAATDSLSQANQEGENRYQAIARATLERKAALDAEIRSQMAAGGETRKVTAAMREQWEAYSSVASAEHQARLASERQAAAMKAAAEAAEQNSISLQKLLGQIDPLEAKLNRLDDMEMQLNSAYRQGAVDLETYGIALAKINGQRQAISDRQLKQVASGAEQAAASMSKFGVHTAQAQRDLITLARAASSGNWTQASSSMVSLGRSSGVMASAFSVAGVSILGLVGSVGVLAAAYYKGQQEAEGYNRALILTGNYAGYTSGQMAEMAARIGDSVGTTAKAAQALTLIAGSGKIAGQNMEQIGKAAVAMSEATGRSVQDIVREFESLGRDPVRAIVELNDRYHFLTASVYDQIAALVDQGREQDAISLAERTYVTEMQIRAQQVVQNVGHMEKAWQSLWGVVTGTWDAMAGIGRETTLTDQIALAQAEIAALERTIATGGSGLQGQGRDYASIAVRQAKENLGIKKQELQVLQNQAAIEGWQAEVEREHRQRQEKGISSIASLNDRYNRSLDRTQQKMNEIAEIEKEIRDAAAAGTPYDPEKIASIYADVDKRYADKTPKTRTRIDEGERLLAQMNERLGLIGKETEYEKMLAQIQSGRYSDLLDWQKEAALDLAQQIDATTRQIETERILKDLREQQSLTQRQFMRDLESFGQSDSVRELNDELARVEDRYRSIIETRRSSPMGLSDDELEQIKESLEIELEMVRAHHIAKKDLLDDWRLGAVTAVRDYVEEAESLYLSVGNLTTDVFKGMEGAIADFVTTGKASFGDFANSIIKEMIRMTVQAMILAPLMRAMGFAGGGAGGGIDTSYAPDVGGFFATGGYTGDGGKYEPAGIVHKGEGVLSQDEIRALGGEAGFNALRRAIRGPGHASGGLGGRPSLPPMPVSATGTGAVNVTVNVSREGGAQVNAPAGMEGMAREIGQFVEAKIREHEARSQRQGGVAWQARQGAF